MFPSGVMDGWPEKPVAGAPVGVTETRIVDRAARSRRYSPPRGAAMPSTRFVAVETKATYAPLPEIAGSPASASAGPPSLAADTRVVRWAATSRT